MLLNSAAALLALLPLAPTCPPHPQQGQGGPPGLVFVKGGQAQLGTSVKRAEEMIRESEAIADFLAGETPNIREKVDDFWLMPTEVTNEQYAAYVTATGAHPPHTWGDEDAVEKARAAFLEEQAELRRIAREEGKAHERKLWDVKAWWEDNWEETAWSVPQNLKQKPASWVDFRDAVAYADWAGLRLLTEAEFHRAGRGDDGRDYTWKGDWLEGHCSSQEAGLSEAPDVGSYPDGMTSEGIFDLCGSVWEWTLSPYSPFKGYKALKVKVGKRSQVRTVDALAPFDPSHQVLVGGSYLQDHSGVRMGVRFGAMPTQSTAGVGFRCAASVSNAADIATTIMDKDLHYDVFPEELDFYPPGSLCKQHWTTEEGAVGASGRVPGYAVITGHQRFLFTPALELPVNSLRSLQDMSDRDGPVIFGFLSLSSPTLEPALDAGTYLVAYRSKGKVEAVKPEEDPDGEATLPAFTTAVGFVETKNQFIYFDLEGAPLVAAPARDVRYERMKGGNVLFSPFEPPKRPDPKKPVVPMDTLTFQAQIAGKGRSKGMRANLVLKLTPGIIDDSWQ